MATAEFIAQDRGGAGYARWTHVPSGKTCLRERYMVADNPAWIKRQLEFFQNYPTLTIHKCPGTYHATEENKIATVEELIAELNAGTIRFH